MKEVRYRRKKKHLPLWAIIVIDVLAAGAILCVFAFFHHVQPRSLQSLDVVIANPAESAQPSPAASETAGWVEEPEDTPEPTPTPPPTWAEKFAEHFTDTVIETDTSYSSPNISINIEKVVTGEGREQLTYFVADIYVTDIKYFQTYLAENTYGKGYRENVIDLDAESGALVAITGDFYGYQDEGVVIRNGVLYRADETDLDICILYYNGTVECFSPEEFDIDAAIAKGAYQGWTFGPMLLDKDGNVPEEYNTKSKLLETHPRTGFGCVEPGHYVFIVVDGRARGYSRGVTLAEFSQIFKDLGCTAAYNLDGGESAVMCFNDAVVNRPYEDGRRVSDILLIKEVEE